MYKNIGERETKVLCIETSGIGTVLALAAETVVLCIETSGIGTGGGGGGGYWNRCARLHYQPPRRRLLVPGVFKLSCSTAFTPFLRLVSVYRSFHLKITTIAIYFIHPSRISFQKLSTIPLFQLPSCS